MIKAPTPDNEKERLKTLHEYEALETPPEKHFDEITKTASLICECKISVISLVDSERQWFKSTQGIDATGSARDLSYCGHTIMGDDLMIVEDAEKDERFCDNPSLLNAPHARFYAGAPLIAPNGHRIGTLCVIDNKPRNLSDEQKLLLKTLSKQVVNYLELAKRKVKEISELRELESFKKGLDVNAIIARTDKRGRITYVNDKFCEVSGYSRNELIGKDHRMINSGYH
ncbi:MAG: GAF domain-containing protein, partial [Bacteriovoracaceae bacterium]